MSLSVIGAGFGRTGTLSLRLALQQLGFSPCYHMLELQERPDHAVVWERAADRGKVDWDELLRGYPAAVDWPACSFFRELATYYPRAKVILTVRDPDRWFKSVTETIFTALQQPLQEGNTSLQARRRMQRKLIIDGTFGGWLDDREHVIGTYERHNEAVKQAIPAHRLLVFDVAEGWRPLCHFLGVPVPEKPFPRVNSTEEFRQMVETGTLHKVNARSRGLEPS